LDDAQTNNYLMNKSRFLIPKMDCGAEEQLVRMALHGRPEVHRIEADLTVRELVVLHEGTADAIAALLIPLNLGAETVDTTIASQVDEHVAPGTVAAEARTVKIVLAINAVMFVGELIGAYWADSSALLADSLDMFADATVYGIALFGVYRSHSIQLKAARLAGVLQLSLALGAFAEVARRLIFGSDPDAPAMVIVTLAALAANVTSLWLLARYRTSGTHMKASWICTQTDVVANFGVIAAALMVYIFRSALPDLVVATVIAFVVLTGAIRILRLRS
jgi:Co/Zn/Cd efflux system component